MREIWKKVVGYDFYEVSNFGRVRSWKGKGQYGKKLKSPTPKKTFIGADGYVFVKLQQNGKRTSYRIHRVVLEAFVGKRPEGLVARHLDGDKTNNTLWNLMWDTYKANILDKKRHGTDNTNERHGNCSIPNDTVRGIKKELAANRVSQAEVARMFGVRPQYVYKVKTGVIRSTCN